MAARGRGRGAPPPASGTNLLAEAERLQQQAERRKGMAACAGLESAAAVFARALEAGLPDAERPDALMGMGECLQLWASTLLEAVSKLPDDHITWEAEASAKQTAAGLYERSAAAYQQVTSPAGMRPDAAVGFGNGLCAWAELLPPRQAAPLVQQAVEAYRHALAQEEDALTLSNLADALVQLGTAQLEAAAAMAGGQQEQAAGAGAAAPGGGAGLAAAGAASGPGALTQAGREALHAALQAYERSCALTDTEAGDDLPGLLHNWGVGLYAVSKWAQDAGQRSALLEQAASKLRAAIGFSRGDTAPHNALGDVLMAQAEALAGPPPQAPAEPGGSPPSAAAAAAAEAVRGAVEEGYQAALTISRANGDALVGLAEAAVALGKLAAGSPGEGAAAAAAAAHFQEGAQRYAVALRDSTQLGSVEERCNVRYNHACALALAGRAEEAGAALAALAGAGGLGTRAEVEADADLAACRGQPWWPQLLDRLQT